MTPQHIQRVLQCSYCFYQPQAEEGRSNIIARSPVVQFCIQNLISGVSYFCYQTVQCLLCEITASETPGNTIRV